MNPNPETLNPNPIIPVPAAARRCQELAELEGEEKHSNSRDESVENDEALARALAQMDGEQWGTEAESEKEGAAHGAAHGWRGGGGTEPPLAAHRTSGGVKPRPSTAGLRPSPPQDPFTSFFKQFQPPTAAHQFTNAPSNTRSTDDAELAKRLQQAEMRGMSWGSLSSPEVFSSKPMLYVPGSIAGRPIDLFVDTGAQSSVISDCMVRSLNLSHQVDRYVRGQAQGVGKANITGLLHGVPVQVGVELVEFEMAFLVLSTEQPLLIMGLDQMRKYKCVVDLEKDCLVFGGYGGISVPFVSRPAPSCLPHRPDECCIS